MVNLFPYRLICHSLELASYTIQIIIRMSAIGAFNTRTGGQRIPGSVPTFSVHHCKSIRCRCRLLMARGYFSYFPNSNTSQDLTDRSSNDEYIEVINLLEDPDYVKTLNLSSLLSQITLLVKILDQNKMNCIMISRFDWIILIANNITNLHEE